MIGSKGKAQGPVRIVMSAQEIGKVIKGDVDADEKGVVKIIKKKD